MVIILGREQLMTPQFLGVDNNSSQGGGTVSRHQKWLKTRHPHTGQRILQVNIQFLISTGSYVLIQIQRSKEYNSGPCLCVCVSIPMFMVHWHLVFDPYTRIHSKSLGHPTPLATAEGQPHWLLATMEFINKNGDSIDKNGCLIMYQELGIQTKPTNQQGQSDSESAVSQQNKEVFQQRYCRNISATCTHGQQETVMAIISCAIDKGVC